MLESKASGQDALSIARDWTKSGPGLKYVSRQTDSPMCCWVVQGNKLPKSSRSLHLPLPLLRNCAAQ